MELFIEDVSNKNALNECLLLIKPVAEDRSIEIILGEGFNSEVWTHTDSRRLKQSLLNLMSNAVKYNRENGKITVDCRKTLNGMLRITVADTGEGIADDMLEILYQPFSRLGEENSVIEGTGIGLTITKQLIESMGGHIGVESKVGEGSNFWIEVPLRTGRV